MASVPSEQTASQNDMNREKRQNREDKMHYSSQGTRRQKQSSKSGV